jgi:1-phosphofructokinase
VDASGIPLQHALKARPWALKPNLIEFHQIVGVETSTLSEHIEQLSRIAGVYAEVLLLSLGQDGLLVADGSNVWHLTAPSGQFTLPDSTGVNTCGCGDALVGGFSYYYVRSQNILDSACWGIACATVTLGTYGVPSCPADAVRAFVDQIKVVEIAKD